MNFTLSHKINLEKVIAEEESNDNIHMIVDGIKNEIDALIEHNLDYIGNESHCMKLVDSCDNFQDLVTELKKLNIQKIIKYLMED